MIIFFATFFLGAILASFFNVVAKSVPTKQNWYSRRSACPLCQTLLKPWQLIPILSYLMQKGKCQTCKSTIPISYLVVEFVGGLLFTTTLFLPFAPRLQMWLFLAMLFTVTLTDLYFQLIPNKILITFGIPLFLLQPQIAVAILSFLFFYLTGLIGSWLFKKETIGGGDIKLYLVIGFVLTLEFLLLSIVITTVTALLYILLWSKNKKQAIPFAPFIALGSLFSYLLMFW